VIVSYNSYFVNECELDDDVIFCYADHNGVLVLPVNECIHPGISSEDGEKYVKTTCKKPATVFY